MKHSISVEGEYVKVQIKHNPPGYELSLKMSRLDNEHVLLQTGQEQAISLDEEEVKAVIGYLQHWLDYQRGHWLDYQRGKETIE